MERKSVEQQLKETAEISPALATALWLMLKLIQVIHRLEAKILKLVASG